MGISTFDKTPWPAIVYFIPDEDLNLQFVSHPDDKHSKNLETNPDITCTIYDSSQLNKDEKLGLQYLGSTTIVKKLNKLKILVKFWNKHIAGEHGVRFDPKTFLRAGSSRIYKITPKKIKFFNTRDYTDNDFKIYKPDFQEIKIKSTSLDQTRLISNI